MKGKIVNILKAGENFILTIMAGSCEFESETDVEVKKVTKHRSLSANSYFHVLVGKIADRMTATGTPVSKAHVKNMLLARYGQRMLDIDNKPLTFRVKAKTDLTEREDIHTALVGGDDNYDIYEVVRGSSTYNSAEFSILIKGTILEARQLGGIETLTPNEIKELEGIAEHYNG